MDDEDKSVFWYYEICPFRAYQRSFRLFHGNFSKDIHPRIIRKTLCYEKRKTKRYLFLNVN